MVQEQRAMVLLDLLGGSSPVLDVVLDKFQVDRRGDALGGVLRRCGIHALSFSSVLLSIIVFASCANFLCKRQQPLFYHLFTSHYSLWLRRQPRCGPVLRSRSRSRNLESS